VSISAGLVVFFGRVFDFSPITKKITNASLSELYINQRWFKALGFIRTDRARDSVSLMQRGCKIGCKVTN